MVKMVKVMDSEERERILAQAKTNLDPIQRRKEQAELAQRTMALPASDPVKQWREAGEEQAQRFAAAKREQHEEQEAKAAAAKSMSAAEWAAWVTERVKAEREFILEVCAGALTELSEMLHKDFTADLDSLKSDLKRERDAHRVELRQVGLQTKAMTELHIRELAQATTLTAALERRVDRLTGISTADQQNRKLDDLRKDLGESIVEARRDIMKLKLN